MLMGADGVMAPFRRNPGTAKGRTKWREVKVGIMARWGRRTTRAGKQVPQLVHRRVVAVLGDAAQLRERLHLEALRQGFHSAPRVVWLSDGAIWLWRIFTKTFSSKAIGVLDFYHAAQNIWNHIQPYFEGNTRAAKRYFRAARRLLRRGNPDRVLRDLQEASRTPDLPANASSEIRILYRYLKRHRAHIDYAKFEEMGIPLGSGMVESACKWLVQQRFKGVGMRWSEEGFSALLHLRLAWVNSRFDHLFLPCRASPNG
jgi:hypothetical protein